MVPLGDVATIERRGVDPTTLPPETRYVGLEHIERGGRIVGHETVGTASLASMKFAFTEQHLLFGKLRPNLGKIALPGFSGVCSTDILPLRAGPHLDRTYLAHYLTQPSMVDFAASRATGANLPRLSPAVLQAFPVPLPHLDEQRRIAAILDQADALRAKRRQALTDLDSLPRAIFAATFAVAGLGLVGTRPLSAVVSHIDSGSSPVCDARRATTDEWGVLKLGAVTYGTFRERENKAYLGDVDRLVANEVRPGDVLMTRKNTPELVGAVAVVGAVRPRLLIPDLIFRLHLDTSQVAPRYFQALMMSRSMRAAVRSLSSGSAASMPNISKARLRTLQLPVPPMSLQLEFTRRVEAVDAQCSRAQRVLADHDQLVSSLQQRAFLGRL